MQTTDAPGQQPLARRSIFWRTSFSPPEVAAVALLAAPVLFAAGYVVSLTDYGAGWRARIIAWTTWATTPWLPALLLVSSLLAWYLATTSRDVLLAVGDPDDDQAPSHGSEASSGHKIAELWDHQQRAMVIAALAGFVGALTALAVILMVVAVEWPGTLGGAVTPVYASDIAAVLEGLGSAVPALATVVVFAKVHSNWKDLLAADVSADSQG
jgi:hypothetical protein